MPDVRLGEMEPSPMNDLFQNAGSQKPRNVVIEVAKLMLPKLRNGGTISGSDLNEMFDAAAAQQPARGPKSVRDTYNALELLQVMAIQADSESPGSSPILRMEELAARLSRLPTQSRRTEDQVLAQQFSTPATLAYAVALAAQLKGDDKVLEPSAGTGLLAAFAPATSALTLNELDESRRGLLAALFPQATVLGIDGAMIDTRAGGFDVVLMNPPFSSSISAGEDRHAAGRHLAAGLRACRPAGRVVAIMPSWFEGRGREARSHAMALGLGALRLDVLISGKLYAKHGTSIETRLMVFDRGAEGLVDPRSADTLAELVEAVLSVAPRATQAEPGPPRKIATATSLFARKPAELKRPAIGGPARRSDAGSHEIVRYQPLDEPSAAPGQVGLYLPYRPSRVAIADAITHPAALVESIAMGSIATPKPASEPVLPGGAAGRGLLSDAQLETLILGTHAHGQDLPGLFVPDKDGVELVPRDLDSMPAEDVEAAKTPQPYRMGFFLGDGTGAGKGRQVAAFFMDQWLRGSRRHIWLSKNEDLLEDARRDWAAIGGLALDVQPLSQFKLGEPLALTSGILFVTYPTLRSGRGDATRLDQILAWCAGDGSHDFEGVIAFDEAHAMANAAGGEGSRGKVKGSEQGIAGLRLQTALPRARIVYVSATGASDVNNLAYARRLDLWGPTTAFATRDNFVTEIRRGGVAAMEVVARELKARGLYVARALSFAGVEYDALEHALTPAQIAEYDAYADAWAIIHQNLHAALLASNVIDAHSGGTLNSGAKSAALSVFEGAKQRFFGQLLLSAKLPSLLRAMREDLAAGNSVVVQLVSTAEAVLERRLAEMTPDELEDLSLDLSPREYMLDYLQAGFPTVQMEVFTDSEGFVRSRVAKDDAGNIVHSPEALQRRDGLIEKLAAMPAIPMALDALLAAFGPDEVAEVTGRTRRLIVMPDGRQKIDRRSPRSNVTETAAFMEGRKRILVFSDAGGTGRSYHASLDSTNQSRRIHYLLEPGWRADAAIQGLGRTHRTRQASAPLFRPVTTDCRGERRFISTIARRLDSLGALTRGQRQTGGQNMFNPADNLESAYARDALLTWYRLLWHGKLTSVSMTDFERMTGLTLTDNSGDLVEDLPPIQRWLNRLLALRIGVQNAIFEEFQGLIEARVEAARRAGTLDIGLEDVRVEAMTVVADRLVRTDSQSGGTTHLLTLEVERKVPFTTSADALSLHARDPDRVLVVNKRSGHAAVRTKGLTHMDEDGRPIPTFDLYRPTRRQCVEAAGWEETHWAEATQAEWETAWDQETAEVAVTPRREKVHFVTGLLLPVWNKLPGDWVKVVRLSDAAGHTLLGREIASHQLTEVGRKLGYEVTNALGAGDIVAAVLKTGVPQPFEGIDTLTIRRSRVGGDTRVEIVGFDQGRLAWYKAQGCFTEIIQWKTRLFLPAGQEAATLERLRAA